MLPAVQMLTARNLNGVQRPLPEGQFQKWMWNGASIDAALELALPAGEATSLLQNSLTRLLCVCHK